MFTSSQSHHARRRSGTVSTNRIRASVFCSYSEPESVGDEAVTFKIADSQFERISAFRLVYEAYVRAGLMRPNAFKLRVMPHHLLPTTATFVALRGERVIATVTLVGDGRLGLPLERVYGPEVDAMRQPDTWLGEVSALASAPTEADSKCDVVIGLMRLMAQFSRRHGLEHLLVAVHPRHARLYRRAMGFQPLGEERPYPSVCNRPAVALHLDLSRLDQAPPENVALFFGEDISDDRLRFCPISASERRHFAPAVVWQTNVTDAESPGAILACA
jgi:hypothetical protein